MNNDPDKTVASESPILRKLGRYEIVRELGKGAMGVVYEGRDPNIGRRVAIKTSRTDLLGSDSCHEEMLERFLREARAAGTLNHPHIITIYDADEQNGVAYIAMEFVDGTDLHRFQTERRRIDPVTAAELGATICRALAHAHEHGVVHRDIKPSNIMMLENGTIKIADFGIAHITNSTLTADGALIGTPHYMSPEQCMGQPVDGRSDLFAVGVILYEMLTGEKPFTGQAFGAIIQSIIRTTPIPPAELNFAVNDTLSQVVLKSLNKRPDLRYQSGDAMAAALIEAVKPNPDPAITQVSQLEAGPDAGEPTLTAPPAARSATVATAPGGSFASTVVESPSSAVSSVPGAHAPVQGEMLQKPAVHKARRKHVVLGLLGAATMMIAAAAVYHLAMPDNGRHGAGPGTWFGELNVSVWDYPAGRLDDYEGQDVLPGGEFDTGAEVAVKDTEGNLVHSSQVKDGLWRFEFGPGQYYERVRVAVSKQGYRAAREDVVLQAQRKGDVGRFDFLLFKTE